MFFLTRRKMKKFLKQNLNKYQGQYTETLWWEVLYDVLYHFNLNEEIGFLILPDKQKKEDRI